MGHLSRSSVKTRDHAGCQPPGGGVRPRAAPPEAAAWPGPWRFIPAARDEVV